MRSICFLASLSLGLLAGAAGLTAGCFSYQTDCHLTLECSEGSMGTGGADGGPPPGCDPTTTTDPVGTSCGIFVSPSGDDSHTGSQSLPLKTLGAAVARGGIIYACQGATPYTEAVTIGQKVTIFGALDCTKWSHLANQKSQLTAAAGMVPLSLTGKASGTAIHDFTVTAVDATAAGGSSIAIVDDSAALTLDGVDVSAGKGAAGTAGAMPPMQVMTPATANGIDGNADMACNMPGVFGGTGGKNTCGGTTTDGGLGGQGAAATTGGSGTSGSPMTPPNGGAGQTLTMACGTGQPGAQGLAGATGAGAHGIGAISALGFQATSAMTGAAGSPGQGGGGGGGARQCDTLGMFAGPSGGGGGAGGCGGMPGAVGTSGGSSIGIIALNATLTMTAVSITTHAGGVGGLGGDGQQGTPGGSPGHAPSASNACDGGKGGQGGIGGGGGGGAGGHSLGIAVSGGAVPDLKGATVSYGMGGTGAVAGNMDSSKAGRGDDGFACKTLDFGNPMSAMACVM